MALLIPLQSSDKPIGGWYLLACDTSSLICDGLLVLDILLLPSLFQLHHSLACLLPVNVFAI